MAVKTVLKYVLLVLVALMALSSLIETVVWSINIPVNQGKNGKSAMKSAGLLLGSLTGLALDVIGLYGIFNEHFICSLIFSVVSVLSLIGMIFLSLIVFQEVYMVYVILGVAVLTAMMVSYTIMIREKTPVEGSIAYTKMPA